jgi:hypothetical protein
MVNLCRINNKGFLIFDYDTRATNSGYTHEVAAAHTPKWAHAISAIHASTSIIADHVDSDNKLFICAYTVTTTFEKHLIASNNKMAD